MLSLRVVRNPLLSRIIRMKCVRAQVFEYTCLFIFFFLIVTEKKITRRVVQSLHTSLHMDTSGPTYDPR